AGLHPLLPVSQALAVGGGVIVVAALALDVDGDNLDTVQTDGHIPFQPGRQVLVQVGEDKQLLVPGRCLVQVVACQQYAAGNIAVVAGHLEALHKGGQFGLQLALLRDGHTGAMIEGGPGDDIALGKTAVVDKGDGQRVSAVQPGQQNATQNLGLVQFA